MKKKLFAFFILVFGLCGTLGYFSLQQKGETEAASITASVWDGKYYGINELTDDDWYEERVDTKTIYHIRSARGFSYLVYTVNGLEGRINRYIDAEIVLETDIDLNNHDWIPIGYTSGSSYNSFMGSLDGKGHYIYNLKISQDASGNFKMTDSYEDYIGAGANATVTGVGLFGVLYGRGVETAVKNLHLRNVNINVSKPSAGMGIGTLVGETGYYYSAPHIQNCSVGGSLSVSNINGQILNIGGAVGSADGALIGTYTVNTPDEDGSGEIITTYLKKGIRSFVDISLSGTNDLASNLSVGGIVGKQTKTKLSGSAHEGSIDLNGLKANVGGIVGVMRAGSVGNFYAENRDTVEDCYNVGKINNVGPESSAGGIFGLITTGTASGTSYSSYYYFLVKHVYNAGTITNCGSSTWVGGLVGDMTTSTYYIGNIEQSMQLNNSIVDSGYMSSLGHMFGRNFFSGIGKEVYYEGDYTDLNSNSVGTITELSKLARSRGFYVKGQTGFAGTGTEFECPKSLWANPWQFTSTYYGNYGTLYKHDGIWEISDNVNDGLPYIYIDGNVNNDIDTTIQTGLRGAGTAENPYLIETAGDLAWLSDNWENASIDANGVASYNYYTLMNDIDLTGRTWVPIAYSAGDYFSGVFDGNGFKIVGMTCSLYQQFEYHSLFAKTQNAVIKNLTIEDVRYVNEGTEAVRINKANLIGYAGENTYIINCADLSDNGENTIATTDDDNLSVFYGKNNFTNNIWNVADKKIKLPQGKSYLEGFDVEINGDGGTFYDSDKNVYSNYHTLLLENPNDDTQYIRYSSVVYFDQYKMFRNIDTTYAEWTVPKTSESEGEKDVLGVGRDVIIRRGYRLLGYNFGNNVSKTEIDVAPNSAVINRGFFESGKRIELKAMWERFDAVIAIDYNQYETTNFGTSGDYTEANFVDHDAMLYDYYNLFTKYYYTSNTLRPGFKVTAIYRNYSAQFGFSGLVWSASRGIVEDNSRLNSKFFGGDYRITYYAEWEGSSSYVNQLNLNFGRTEEEFLKDFDLKDAIQSVELIENKTEYERDGSGNIVYDKTGTPKTKVNSRTVGNFTDIEANIVIKQGQQTLSLNFNTTTDIAATLKNYYTLKVNLVDGYVLTENVSFGSETENTDASTTANYGVYATKNDDRTKFGYLNSATIEPDYGALEEDAEYADVLNKTNPHTTFRLNNIVDDYNVFFEIARAEFKKPLSVVSGVYFGIAPEVGWYSEVGITYGTSALYEKADLAGYELSQTDEDGNPVPTKIAYNFIDNYVMSSSGNFDVRAINGRSLEENSRVAFRYKISEGEYEFYFYELTTSTLAGQSQYHITMYKAKETGQYITPNQLTKAEKLVTLSGLYRNGKYEDASSISYLSGSSFTLLFSTESTTIKFLTHSPTTSNDVGFTLSYLNKTDLPQEDEGDEKYQYHKLMMSFVDFLDFPMLSTESATGLHEHRMFSDKILETSREKITVVGQYTVAVFEFEYYTKDADGNLTFLQRNAPAPISMIKCPVTDLDDSQYKLEFEVASSNYYKFARDEENGIVFYDLNNQEDFNIKITVDPMTVGEAVENGGYSTHFNDTNSAYFTPNLTDFYKGEKIEEHGVETRATDGFSFVLLYRQASATADFKSLQAGKYVVQIVCEEVLYSVETHTKFLDVDDKDSVEFVDEANHEITTTSSAGTDIKYNQNVSLSTELGTIGAYEFYGWYLQQNSAGLKGDYYRDRNGNIVKNATLTEVYFNLNNQTNQNQIVDEEYVTEEKGFALNRFEIDVYAVYLKKEISFNFSDAIEIKYAIADNQHLQESDYLTFYSNPTRRHSLSISMNRTLAVGDTVTTDFEYKYTTVSTAEEFGTLNFVLSGTNSDAYDIYGLALVDELNRFITDVSGNRIVIWSDSTTEIQEDADEVVLYGQNFDLHDMIKAKMEAGLTSVQETYYIAPILKRKEVSFVFHSGTGLVGTYSDGRNGKIYNSETELVDNEKTFVVSNKVLGDKIDTSAELTGVYGTESASMVLTDLFYTRVGYQNDLYGYYWAKDAYSPENLNKRPQTVQAEIEYFKGLADNDTIHFYRLWDPQVYVVTFDSNGGLWNGTFSGTRTLNQVFDAEAITAPTNVSMVGYNLAGWALSSGEKVFERDGSVVFETTLYDAAGMYIYPANVTLKAIWVEKIYGVTINFNGANLVYHDGELVKDILNDTSMTLEEQLRYQQNYLLDMDSTFADMTYVEADGTEKAIMLSQILPTRRGFRFAGFYVINGTRKTLITDETVFNYNLPTFVDDQGQAFVLYASWEYVENSLALSIKDEELDAKSYTGLLQKVNLSEYFEVGNYETTNFLVDGSGDVLDLELNRALNATLSIVLSGNADVLDQAGLSYSVLNAGTYTIGMTISVLDIAPKLNLGAIWIKQLSFTITITKADLWAEETTNGATLTAKMVDNARRIMEPFFEENSLNGYVGIAQLAKQADSTLTTEQIAELSDAELYEFIMTKYYLLLSTNDGRQHNALRAWTYYKDESRTEPEIPEEDDEPIYFSYEEYLAENDNSEIINNLNYFDYYDYAFAGNAKDLTEIYNAQNLFALNGVKLGEIGIHTLKVFSSTEIYANNLYDLHLYIAENGASMRINNYNVETDAYGAYIKVGKIYIVPQVLDIANLGQKTSYYQVGSTSATVNWQGTRNSVEYGYDTLYNIMGDYYLGATVMTSNAGAIEVDTVYNYYDAENYLYFTDVVFLNMVPVGGVTYNVDVSKVFKLRMTDTYSILNTTGVAEISLVAKKFTKYDETFTYDSLSQQIFTISVTYSLEGEEVEKTDISFNDVGAFFATTASGAKELIYEIKEYADGTSAIFVNSHITNVTFVVNTLYLDEYTALDEWATLLSYSYDGKLEKDNRLSFDFIFDIPNKSFTATTSTGRTINSSADGVTEISYYAVFTDLVKVVYDYSIPNVYGAQEDFLRLGVSTYEDLLIPTVDGFELSSLKEGVTGANLLVEAERNNVFAGASGVYVGVNEQNKHLMLNLVARWKLPDDYEYTQRLDGKYLLPVLSFDSLNYAAVVEFEESAIFEYSYFWQYRINNSTPWGKPNVSSSLSDRYSGANLILNGNGSVSESGDYKLIVNIRLRSEYRAALDEGETDVYNIEAEFGLEFKRILLSSVSANEPTTVVYNALDRSIDMSITYEYYNFDADAQDYGADVEVATLPYTQTGNVVFSVMQGGSLAVAKNVGVYDVVITFNEDYYDISRVPASGYQFEITPYIFDLKAKADDSTFDFNKSFNSPDIPLEKKIYINDEIVAIDLKRESGEDIGVYDVTLSGVSGNNKSNYILAFDGTNIYENSALTAAASGAILGEFEILPATKLVLSYEVTALHPAIINVDFSEDGYSLEVSGQDLLIKNGSATHETLTLKLFDHQNNKEVAGECLNYIAPLIEGLEFKFFNQTYMTTVYDAMLYTYAVGNSTEMQKYYTAVEFDKAFSFVIGRIAVDFASKNISKVFDGSAIQYLELDGTEISNLATYSGVYVEATYATIHAGEDISVALVLNRTADSLENLDNYVLENMVVEGTIEKLQANLTFNNSTSVFAYGDVDASNVSKVLDNTNPFNLKAGAKDVENLLENGYYSITYSVNSAVLTASGFVNVGTHTLEVDYDFNDFDVTSTNPTFEIIPLQVTKNLTAGYITILNTDTLQTYYQEVFTIATGDEISINLYPQNVTLDAYNKPNGGYYALTFEAGSLSATTFAGNVVVTLSGNSNAFAVVEVANTLYVQIIDTGILTQSYNANVFVLTSDGASLTVSSSGLATPATSALRFYETDGTTETDVNGLSFSQFEVSTAEVMTEIVGRSKLILTATETSGHFTTILFDDAYYFEITPKVIDITLLGSLDKAYDGMRSKIVEVPTLAGKIEGDDLSVSVVFETQVVKANQAVTLYLQGEDKTNYSLSSTETTANLVKANATIYLSETTYTYGTLKDGDTPSILAKTEDGKVIAKTLYSVDFTLTTTATVSDMDYLGAGSYSIAIENQASAYYVLEMDTNNTFEIEAYLLNFAFNEAGGLKISADDEEAYRAKVSYAYASPLGEVVEISLTRAPNANGRYHEIGDYFVISASTENPNYEIGSVSDSAGFVRIVKSKDIVYLLLSDKAVIAEDDMQGLELSIEYNGFSYDTAEIVAATGGWELSISSSVSKENSEKKFKLNAYQRVLEDGTTDVYLYNKLDAVSVQGLTATAQLKGVAKDVANSYIVNVYNAYSDNYDVRFGKNGRSFTYDLDITPKALYFVVGELDGITLALEPTWQIPYMSKKFDNKFVDFEIQDATSILTGYNVDDNGVISGEEVGLAVKFKDGDDLAKFASAGYYNLEATLIGENAANYALNCTFVGNENTMRARIEKAEMIITASSKYYTYGELVKDAADSVTLDGGFTYSTDVDLDEEYTSRYIDNKIFLQVISPTYSTSNALCAGEYNLRISSTNSDFAFKFVINGVETASLENLKVTINKKVVEVVEKAGGPTLREVFTKTYDGYAGVDNLNFDISGLLTGDEVNVVSATYATANIGDNIQVLIEINGDDIDNYQLKPYLYGVIRPIVISLKFNYDEDTVSDVTSIYGLTEVSQLKYPFVSSGTLTANSNDISTSSTNNFPTMLFREGKNFSHWSMRFGIGDNAIKKTFLENATSGMTTSFDEASGTFEVVVGNNAKTVSFLSKIIGDDITNMLGYYYKNNANPEIVFEPNFTTQQILLNINIIEQNGGTVKVAYDSTEREVVKQTTMSFDYGTIITLTATPNEHFYFTGWNVGNAVDTNESYTINGLTVGTEATANFAVQLVNIEYDLTGIDSSEVTLPNGFVDNVLASNYAELATKTLANMALEREGYQLSEIQATVGGVVSTVAKADFANITIASLLQGHNASPITLKLKPGFEAEKVKVVLNYNYESKLEEIFVPYQGTFAEAKNNEGDDAWVESPLREGYTFAGWWSEDESAGWGEQITGASVLNSTDATTIYAKWNVNSYAVTLTVENAKIKQITGATFVENEGVWTSDAVDFKSEVIITLKPDKGYMVSTIGWADYFEVVIDENGIATIILTMPAEDVDYTLLVEPERNTIVVSGVYLEELSYTVETTTNNEFEDGAAFNIDFRMFTAQDLEIDFVVKKGYYVNKIIIKDKNGEEVDFEDINAEYVYNASSAIVGLKIVEVNQSLSIQIDAKERLNKVTFTFDDWTRIEGFEASDGFGWNITETIEVEMYTATELTFYVQFKLGYTFHSISSTGNIAQKVESTAGTYASWTHIKISGINSDVEVNINSKMATFTIVGKAVSYEMDGSEVVINENIVYVNRATVTSAKIGEEIDLSFDIHKDYEFAGWSIDGITAFSSDPTYSYTLSEQDLTRIKNDEITLYGIFSKLQYKINFGTYSYYTVGTEYNDEGMRREIYEEITGKYLDESGNEITMTTVYYGTNKEITFKIPVGYSYIGFGYNEGSSFKMLAQGEDDGSGEIKIIIYSTDANISDGMKLYFVVAPLSANIKIKNQINYDGSFEDDKDVGSTTLYGANGSYVINQHGYIDGTKVHFADGYFADGKQTNDKNFNVVAYSGDEIYLKVGTIKDGYYFDAVSVGGSEALMIEEERADNFVIYRLTNIVGGGNDIEISILFKPQVNLINLSFVYNNLITDGGAFDINISTENSYKVFTSGKEYSSVVVSAFTDTEFEVVVYIRAGFYVPASLEGVIDDLGKIVVKDSPKYTALSVTETGYTGMISFAVKDYLGNYNISILLSNMTYTVNLKENATTLATIKNVEFDKLLNLSETNSENITIFDERFSFIGGRLYTILTLDKHNFEGYFTGQNGAGVQYIDGHGDAINYWNESGYMLDNLTSTYVLTENAYFDEELGEMIIDLFVYMSYLKTRISFEIVPNMNIKITAQDLVGGVDYTNSWYYSASPMYMEVSYNTDITFNAPEIEGYIFYKFVISQRNANGEWLTDVESTQNSVPWSTNEFAQIVECKVKVVYFAQVVVTYIGGDASVSIVQEGTPQNMLDAGYVDTTKAFSVNAVVADGYEFVYWKNMNNGNIVPSATYNFARITNKLTLQLYLKGKTTVLNFVDYDATFGYIRALRLVSRDHSQKLITLGTLIGGRFTKLITETSKTDETRMVRVGDVVSFEVWIDFGFSAVWNREDIILRGYQNGYYNFEMTVPADSAGQTLKIIPTFTDALLSFYVNSQFDEIRDDAVDLNYVDMAGYVTYNGEKTTQFTSAKGQEMQAEIVVNKRYAVSKVSLVNYTNTYDDMTKFLTEDNKIVLTRQFMEENTIVGNVQILIKFKRVLWESLETEHSLEGDGTSKNKYRIESVEDLVLAMQLINSGASNSDGLRYRDACYVLVADLDLSDCFWTPIGTKQNAFNGEFDFGKCKISGIYNAYFYSPIHYNGLFGYLGPNANIHETNNDLWYILLAAGIFVIMLILLIVLILRNKRKKKRRQELAHK